MQQTGCPSGIEVQDDGWFRPGISEEAERIPRLAAFGILIDGYLDLGKYSNWIDRLVLFFLDIQATQNLPN